MRILHSTSDWLALTKNWIHTQIKFMPEGLSQSVWCDRLIPGPHYEWDGEVLLTKNSLLSKIFQRVNSRLNQVIFTSKASFDLSNFDVLFSHFGYRAWQDLQYVKGLDIKKVVRFYGCDLGYTVHRPGWDKKYELIFDEYDLFLAEGPYMASELVRIGAPENKVNYVNLGIDCSNLGKPKRYIDKFMNPLKILICGTFTEKKGIEYALKGILSFCQSNSLAVNVTLVGDANPSVPNQVELKKKIISLVKKMREVNGCTVKMLGYISFERLQQLMDENLVLISSSVTASNGDVEGGFPITLTHGASKGMILIGSEHCDLPQIVKHDFNGFLVKERDYLAIADCLEKIVQMSPEKLNIMSRNSIKHVKNHFNAIDTRNEIYRLISEIIEK